MRVFSARHTSDCKYQTEEESPGFNKFIPYFRGNAKKVLVTFRIIGSFFFHLHCLINLPLIFPTLPKQGGTGVNSVNPGHTQEDLN